MSSDLTIQIGLAHLQLLQGDITQIRVDAIVNAANSELIGGGGVDGAIHRVGGPDVMRELDGVRQKVGRCPAGQAVVTGAGRLPAKFVFHAVGPIYRDGASGEPETLASCYSVCLDLAEQNGAKTISFPSISTGVYGYPGDEAADIALATVTDWLRERPGVIDTVKLVQFSRHDHEVYRRHAELLHDRLARETRG